ncbi:MAG TPA: ABC transporter ATP-binding protein [Elainellaceae cyanobacterium]
MPSSSTVQIKLEQASLVTQVGAQPILSNISTEIFQGDRIAVVGPSGSGKTSLFRLLNRLSELSQGRIYLEGQDIYTIPVIQLRQQITLVPQESRLLGMTVQEALAYPLQLRGLAQSDIRQRLATWTDRLNIPNDWLDRREIELSVGQRQLIAIARGVMIQPKVLLLDEPTSALDAGRGNQVIKLFQRVADEQQTTVMMINHQLDLARQFCSRVFYIRQGQLVHDCPTDQIDWPTIKDDLVQAELDEEHEWG